MCKEKIEEMAKDIDDIAHNAYIENYDDAVADSDKIAEVLYNADYRKQAWISVDERLPEDVYGKEREQITVLVYTKGKKVSQCSRCAEYDLYKREPLERDIWKRNGKFYWSKNKQVTHWMPLPEPPKMKGGAE